MSTQSDRTFSLATIMQDGAARWPDKVAVVDGVRRFTYREFERWTAQIAASLARAGLRGGDAVMIVSPNNAEMLAVQVACWRIGLLSAPVIPIYRQHEFRQIIAMVEPKAAVVISSFSDREPCTEIDESFADAGVEPMLRLSIGPVPSGWIGFPALDAEDVGDDQLPTPADPSAASIMLFTSGSTAAPKGVLISSRGISSSIGIYASRLTFGPDESALAMAPMSHIAGLVPGFFLPMTLGGSCVILPRWQITEAVKLIAREKVTYTGGATVFLQEIVEEYEAGNDHGHRLRRFFSAGAATPVSLVERADALGLWAARVYGMTETSLITMAPEGASLERRATWDGMFGDFVEVRVTDDDGREVSPGEGGNIYVRGPMLMLGYTDPEANAAQLSDDGWFNTGDVGLVTRDGWLKMTGRTKDIINRGGEKFAARDIEDALVAHPDITRAAVIAIPHQRLGETVCAFITVREGVDVDPASVAAFLLERSLAKAKIPAEIHVVPSLPVSPTGKIEKKKLNALRGELQQEPSSADDLPA